MNKERIFEWVQNVFHWEISTVSADGNSVELSTNYWPIQGVIEVAIRPWGVKIYNKDAFAGVEIHSYDSTEEVSKALVEFIARILLANPSNDNLAWPYNCNLSYIPYIIKELNNDKELTNSRRAVKSGYDNEIYRQAFGALLEDRTPTPTIPGHYRVLVDGNYETEFSADSQEDAIQQFKDYFENKKSIKSAADTDLNYMDPGYFRWVDGVIYDKDNNHWDFRDYINGNVEPYATYMDAVKATADAVEDSYTKDEIAEPWEYAEYLVTYALEQLPDPGKFCKEYEGL